MNNDHEIALMYAPSSLGIFQPRTNMYSPFSNVVLRVIQPARPSLEDILYQLFASEDTSGQGATEPPVQTDNSALDHDNPTPYDDLSERMAREMQEQEDREQAMREQALAFKTQFGGFMSSLFGGLPSGNDNPGSMFRDQQVNAEAGPSTTKKPMFKTASGSGLTMRSLPYSQMAPDDELALDDSEKRAGKRPARVAQLDPTSYTTSELLDNIEAALRYEVNRFDFPEQLEFLPHNASPAGSPASPILLHTPNNASVHAFENALMDLRANLDLVRDGNDESVVERRSQLDGRIRRELEDLDRKVLEAWAAKRKYSPSPSTGSA